MCASSSRSVIFFSCVLGLLSAPMHLLQGSDPRGIGGRGPAIATLGISHSIPGPEYFDMGLDPSLGREIQGVHPGSTAEVMGVRPGDVIIGINGIPVTDGMSMRYELINSENGDPIHLTIWRDGNEIELNGNIGPGKAEWRGDDLTEVLEHEREYRTEQRQRINEELQKLTKDQSDLRQQIDEMKRDLSVPQSAKNTAESTVPTSAWILRWRLLTNDARLVSEPKPLTGITNLEIGEGAAMNATIPKDK
jgi:hypothetical protein